MTGVLGLIAGALHLSVPSYALRLVRRFGARRVGWYVVAVFLLLTLLHVGTSFRPFSPGPDSDFALNLILGVGAVLLLIGMGHLETLCSERDQRLQQEIVLREQFQQRAATETSFLVKRNEDLKADLARRAESEQTLARAEAQYRSLFFELPQPIWVFDTRSLQVLAVNRAALCQYGFAPAEFVALNARNLVAEEDLERFEQDLLRPCDDAEARGTWRHVRGDGVKVDVEITALDLKYGDQPARLILAQEISDRERKASKASERTRNELMIRIAQGAAGQFGALFARIEKSTEALAATSPDPKLGEHVNQIGHAVKRGSVLTRQLIAAGRAAALNPEVVDLNGLIRRLNHTLTRIAGDEVTLEYAYGSDLSPALADAQAAEQVLIQLVTNARASMASGGTIVIETLMQHLDADAVPENAAPGRFARISVRDNGSGMPIEVQTRVFEPFFTTGNPGCFAGLGLASARGLVIQQGGWMEFSTEPGTGTEFRVFLPCAPANAVLAHQKLSAARPLNRGTIMLVEPDERARCLARFVLNRNGFRVVEADSASIALVLWQSQATRVSLLVTSAELPGELSGVELARQLKESRSGLKVAYITSGDPDAESSSRYGDVPLITRPFQPDRLLQQVEQCLARGVSGATG